MVRKRIVRSKQSSTKKRSFPKIRKALLVGLSGGQKNLHELSKSSKVNWRTTRNHLIYLAGMGYAREVFNSPQVRIFEITDTGLEALAKNAI
jgi:hypothetical protein